MKYNNLTPFKWCILQNFPFIEATFDAIDNYQLWCKVVEYLNLTIDKTNILGTEVEKIENYFNTLDVQDEINKKLDEMVKTGELQNLLTLQYNNLESEVNSKINTINSKVNSISSGSPAGVYPTLADLQQADPDHSKIYLVEEDGEWYFWNTETNQWKNGGVYQATQISQNELNENINPVITYNYQSKGAVSGYYAYEENQVVLKTSVSHKAIKINLLNNNCYLNYNILETTTIAVGFVVLLNNVVLPLYGTKSLINYPLFNVKELYINFFNNDATIDNFTLTYSPIIREKDLSDLKLSKNNLLNKFSINKNNTKTERGYYQPDLSIQIDTTDHVCCKIPINNDNCYLSFSGDTLPSTNLSYGYIEKNDNTLVSLGINPITNLSLLNVKNIYLNFFTSAGFNFATEFILSYKDSNEDIIYKYDDYIKSNYDFNGKTLCFAGDSITKGFTSGTTQTAENYPKLFSEYVNANNLNIAVGGALYTDGYNDVNTLLEQITNNSNKNVPYLFLAGGVNDCQLGVPLTEFKEAVLNTLNYALNNYTGDIIIITPINNFKTFPQAITNLDYYINIITEVAISLNNERISVVQGYKFDFPNKSSNNDFISLMYGDGLHPSELGYKTAYLRGLIKALIKERGYITSLFYIILLSIL